ncbi:cytochrome P450 [Favolaschia claudopus]|uniref:Cytochrome P450 n=1 Tax=Favolaschia claudopus TaxID=2862362 RepID=A0AAW0CDJ1_9AGAR
MGPQFIQPESKVIPSTILLGLINHLYLNRFEPKSADGPLLALIIQPIALLLALAVPLSIPNIFTAYSAFLSTLASSVVIYRLSPWHPLAHIPGPRLYKISKFWSAWICASGKQHRVNKALHDKYGPFLRTGPNEVSIIHADGVKAVLGTGGFQKGNYYEPRSDPKLNTRSLLSLRGDAHANRRKIWNRGLSTESVQEYESIVAKRVSQLSDCLHGLSGNKVNLAEWIGYFTFDVMGDMAFGGGFEMMRDGGDRDGLWTLLNNGAKNLAVISHVPWLAPTLSHLPSMAKSITKLRSFGATCAANRIKNGSRVKDLWYHLTDEAGLEKQKPTFQEVVADGVLSIVAGSDTTSTAISCFMWFILRNPEMYRRVQAEVDYVYGEGDSTLDSSKHSELCFLAACLNEAMRLQPPVLTNGSRRVPSGGAKIIGACFIADGTEISIPPYSLHRNPENFSSPELFDPDRWLRQHSSDEIFNAAAFVPFSYGAANCVGKPLAWREMLMVTSTLLKRFDFRFAKAFESEQWADSFHDAFVTSLGSPLLVEVTLR